MKNGMVFSSSRGRDRLLLRGSWSHWLQCLQSTKVFQRSHLKISSRRNIGVDILQ